jgi:hypothetical protein
VVDAELSHAAFLLSGIPADNISAIDDVLWNLYKTFPRSVGISRIGPNGEIYDSIPTFSLKEVKNSTDF